MTRNLRMLGLVLMAALAMSAVAVSAASATITKFTSVKGATTEAVKDGKDKVTVTGQEITCENVVYSGGEVPAEEFTELTLTPTYSECQGFGFVAATISGFGAGGCDLVLHAGGTVDLACAAGKQVMITASTCAVHIPAQNGLNKVVYTTVITEKQDALTLHVEVGGMKATHTDGFLCPFTGSGESTTDGFDFTTEIWARDETKKKVRLTDHTIK